MSAQTKPRQPNRHHRRSHHARTQSASTRSVLIDIPREYIESGNTDYFIPALEAMMETGETVRHLRNRLFIAVSGYDKDERELHEIPEVRAFFARLDEQFPYWFWFLNREEPSFLISLLFCLVKKDGGKSQGTSFDIENLRSFMTAHYTALEELGALHRLTPSEVLSRQEAIEKYYSKYENSSQVTTTEDVTPQSLPLQLRFIKLGLPVTGLLLILLAWALRLFAGTTISPLNIAGPILAGLGTGYLLIPDKNLLESSHLSQRHKLQLFCSMAVGTIFSIANDLLLRKL